jgi:acetyltransferase-like isoleucine patch superfamily enzyme
MFDVIGKGEIIIGRNCHIGKGVSVVFKKPTKLTLADYVTLGDGVKIIIDDGCVTIGDWTTIHSNTLVISKIGVSIGCHCWFGQNSILDGTGGLTIDDGVRVGMYSQIWTHVAAGEQIEGCKLYSARPTHIKKDAWLVGSCTVGSGIKIGERAICMNGSNVTKSIPDYSVAAGIPAKIREGLSFYRDVNLDEKFQFMKKWLEEFSSIHNLKIKEHNQNCISIYGAVQLSIYRDTFTFNMNKGQTDVVAFCIESKQYEKKFTELEANFIRFLSGNKARFYPIKDNHHDTTC